MTPPSESAVKAARDIAVWLGDVEQQDEAKASELIQSAIDAELASERQKRLALEKILIAHHTELHGYDQKQHCICCGMPGRNHHHPKCELVRLGLFSVEDQEP